MCSVCGVSWPRLADGWRTRSREHGWPDSATVERVVNNGCNLVRVAHRQCRQDEWKNKHQWRLSFSRAEMVLLNSWSEVQQIVYHMLRFYVKIDERTKVVADVGTKILSSYHIKTVMLWACEHKPSSWWHVDTNVVRICIELLQQLAGCLTGGGVLHYFIDNCSLFELHQPCDTKIKTATQRIAIYLKSITEMSLSEWYFENYVRKCVEYCSRFVSQFLDHITTITDVQSLVSAVVDCRCGTSLITTWVVFTATQGGITYQVFRHSLTMRSCLYWMTELTKFDQRLLAFLTAVTFLHVACKTSECSLRDEFLDVLATTCSKSNDVRRCLNARHSSLLSLSQANMMVKLSVANNSSRTVQLIEIELSKAYLCRALRCEDSDSDSIYCLANIYLAVLYHTTGHYQTAMDHCTMVTRSQDHSQCRWHVVQGELLPKIDDNIENVLGLAVICHYLRTAALNNQQKQQEIAFTPELFAHYLHIRCLLDTQTSSYDARQQYESCFYESKEMSVTDILLFHLLRGTTEIATCESFVTYREQIKPAAFQMDTSKLVELLQQSAVEHLTQSRQIESRDFYDLGAIVTTEFEAMYAYKRGNYQKCLQLSAENVGMLIDNPRIRCFVMSEVSSVNG